MITLGFGKVWSQFRNQPSSLVDYMRGLLKLQGSGRSANPYNANKINVGSPHFETLTRKDYYEAQPKQERWTGEVDQTENPRSMRHPSYNFDKNRARGEGELRRELQAIGFLKTRKVNEPLRGAELERAIARRDMERAELKNIVHKAIGNAVEGQTDQPKKISRAQAVQKNRVLRWFASRYGKQKQNPRLLSRMWMGVPTVMVFALYFYQHGALTLALYLKYAAFVDTYYLLSEYEQHKESEVTAQRVERQVAEEEKPRERDELNSYKMS